MKNLILAFIFLGAIIALLFLSKNPQFMKFVTPSTQPAITPTVAASPTSELRPLLKQK